jgi:hypothetical protein
LLAALWSHWRRTSTAAPWGSADGAGGARAPRSRAPRTSTCAWADCFDRAASPECPGHCGLAASRARPSFTPPPLLPLAPTLPLSGLRRGAVSRGLEAEHITACPPIAAMSSATWPAGGVPPGGWSEVEWWAPSGAEDGLQAGSPPHQHGSRQGPPGPTSPRQCRAPRSPPRPSALNQAVLTPTHTTAPLPGLR